MTQADAHLERTRRATVRPGRTIQASIGVMALGLFICSTGLAQEALRVPPRVQEELDRENREPSRRAADVVVEKKTEQEDKTSHTLRFTRENGGLLVADSLGRVDLKVGVWPTLESFVAHSPPVEETRLSVEVGRIAW